MVNAFPVIYQPIYGHNEWDNKAQRPCEDRLICIKKIYDDLSIKLQRPLRVLDLGSCLGYFSLNIAKWGGDVTAVEAKKDFLEISEFLASEHPDYKIKFVNANIQEFIPSIKDNEYDLVLAFSVFHWVTKQSGFQRAQELITHLSENIPTGLFELAKASKFPDIDLPKDYRDFLKSYFFIRLLNYYYESPPIRRPFFFASNKYAHFDDFGILKIGNIPQTKRKHFEIGDKFVKVVDSSAQNEIQFLKEFGGKNGFPKLYTTLQEKDEKWTRTFIITDKLNGIPLSKVVVRGKDFDSWDLIKQLLNWMIFLEKHGYYQGDLALENFIYTEDKKIFPIDYAMMRHEPISHRWPFNIRLAIFNLINAILKKENYRGILLTNKELIRKSYFIGNLLTEFKMYVSEDKYCRILKLHDDETFFEKLYEILFSPSKPRVHTIAEIEVLEKEQYLHDLCATARAYQESIDSLNQTVQQQEKRIKRLEKIIKEKLK